MSLSPQITTPDATPGHDEARFRAVVEASPYAIFVQAGGRFRYLNPAALALFGCAASADLIDTPVIERFDPGCREQVAQRIARLNEERVAVPAAEERVLRMDGVPVETEVNAVPFEFRGEQGALVFARDLSERIRAERALAEAASDLERHVLERTAELEAANNDLAAFSHSVSHDLRAPLRGIDGWTLALLEDCAPQLDAQAVEYLGRIRTEAERMGQLIDDLLNLSRYTLREMEFLPVDLSALALDVVRELRARAPDRAVDCRVEPGMVARGDAGLLRVALSNLLANAWKFTDRSADPRVEFGAERVGHETRYTVRDNGSGFDMAYAGKLFAPFQRLHRPSEYPGTGMGLATVQRIVARHGGRIWVEAAPQRGAAFHFTLGR
jgi:PAS domain S-box-containing protein